MDSIFSFYQSHFTDCHRELGHEHGRKQPYRSLLSVQYAHIQPAVIHLKHISHSSWWKWGREKPVGFTSEGQECFLFPPVFMYLLRNLNWLCAGWYLHRSVPPATSVAFQRRSGQRGRWVGGGGRGDHHQDSLTKEACKNFSLKSLFVCSSGQFIMHTTRCREEIFSTFLPDYNAQRQSWRSHAGNGPKHDLQIGRISSWCP